MKNREVLQGLSQQQLLDLIELNAKNQLALDGVWFQSVEREEGMERAMLHDREAWKRYTVTEALRIKRFLGLPEQPGLQGLAQALPLRFNASVNDYTICKTQDSLTYRVNDCRVQSARRRKGLPLHPCKSVGIEEYAGFARAIDSRLTCACVSCYPDADDPSCACAWRFTLANGKSEDTE